jgi:L-fuculose-phosphate aldolase
MHEVLADIVAAAHRLASRGMVVGSAGNLSARVDEGVLITATGARLETLTGEEITLVTLDGRQIGGRLAPTSEVELHLGIYADTDARAVAHAHAPLSTAVASVLDELPVIHYQQLLLGGAIRVAPYATFGTTDLATGVREALAGRQAALMSNHGSVAIGHDIATAVEHLELLEWLCTLHRDATSLGRPRLLDDDQQRAVIEAALTRNYGTPRTASPKEHR